MKIPRKIIKKVKYQKYKIVKNSLKIFKIKKLKIIKLRYKHKFHFNNRNVNCISSKF